MRSVNLPRLKSWEVHAKEIWCLFDAVDSGLSIDNIIDLKDFFYFVIGQFFGDFYIIVAANSFEMCCGEKCIDVATLQKKSFSNYGKYKSYILKGKEKKEKREKER